MERQSSSTSCASQASSAASLSSAPYLRVMKTQLNFFMTRLLFMQEKEADSLGARATNARRANNSSNSSMNFNNSASRLDQKEIGGSDGLLLGAYLDDNEESDDICVFNDNARILPNSQAKSMPPVPFPPAAPESPRPVEGRGGIVLKTPTHQPAALHLSCSDSSLPEALPLSDMDLEDREDEGEEDSTMMKSDAELTKEDEEEEEEEEEVVDMEEEEVVEEDSKPAAKERKSVIAVRPEARVFPKNQPRRSKRYTSRDQLPKRRSQSLGRKSEDSGDSDDDGQPLTSINSSSCH